MTPFHLGFVFLCLAAAPNEPPRADAFADAMQEIHKTIQARSVVRPSPRQLAELSLRGLFKGQGKNLPADLAKRLQNEKATDAELRAVLRDGYRRCAEKRELGMEKAVDDAIAFTLKAIDPHASWKPLEGGRCVSPRVSGLGLKWRLDEKKGLPCVLTPFKDGPAYRAGLRAGDLITHVTRMPSDTWENNAHVPDRVAMAGAGVATVDNLLQGLTDSNVVLTVQRDGVKKPFTLLATYGPATAETVFGWRRQDNESWDYRLDLAKKIGYLRIELFGRDTLKELEKALDELEAQGVRRVVLDLRFCEGGLLVSSIHAAEQFLDKGELVVKIQGVKGQREEYFRKDGKKRAKMKVVCLINGDTASAAELFVAALQDHHRASVVGERTRGKGSLQNVEFVDNHRLVFTIALFQRPNGKKLDRMRIPGRDADEWGVTPDNGNVVQLSQKEQDALRKHLERRSYLYRHDDPGKEPLAFKDRQLQQALKVLEH